MSEFEPATLLTLVIVVNSVISALAWIVLAKPLAIYRTASIRFAAANFCISFGLLSSLVRQESDPVVVRLLTDAVLFFGLFLYKKGTYRLFRLPNNQLFDHAILFAISFLIVISMLFPIEYRYTVVFTSLCCAAVLAMTVYAKYHALILNIPRYGSALMVLPIFLLTTLLFVKALSLMLIPDIAEQHFLHTHVDSYEVLWVYLVMNILINCSSIAAALMRLIFKIRDLADHDQLTGLLNRHAISHELNLAQKRFHRDDISFAVLIVDVDHFKALNDAYGHDAGDAAIKAVAATMKSALRETDKLARYGGEEFLALLLDSDQHLAMTVAEKLRKKIADTPFIWDDQTTQISVSIGVCSIQQATDTKELIMQADKALYHAKNTGRNRSVMAFI